MSAVDPLRAASAEQTAPAGEAGLSKLSQRMEMLDERIDNLDSIVSAVVERVMNQTLTVDMVCPHCGHHLQASMVGTVKMKV